MATSKKDKNKPTRICSICGIRKPMPAFLINLISHLKQYGTICSTCRNKTAETWKKNRHELLTPPSTKSKKSLSIDNYYKTDASIQKKNKSSPLKKQNRKIDDLFKKSSAAWAKILFKEDEEDEGGSGGKKRSFGVDYYSKRYAVQKQGQKYATITSTHKKAVATRDAITANAGKNSQAASDKRAKKTMKK